MNHPGELHGLTESTGVGEPMVTSWTFCTRRSCNIECSAVLYLPIATLDQCWGEHSSEPVNISLYLLHCTSRVFFGSLFIFFVL